MNKHSIIFVATLLLTFGAAQAQFTEWGPSDPSPVLNCGDYQWPPVWEPCPEVQVKQKHDHTPLDRYRHEGFDTVVTNCTTEVVLTCTPYIPTQFFNGQYTVDQIPYAPADTSFSMAAWPNNRQQIPINRDDMYGNMTPLDFPFFFFGKKKNHFYIGDNGVVTFTNNFGSGDYCPYSIPTNSTLPWTSTNNNTPGGSSYFDRMHDAIYGIFEDTHAAGFGTSYLHGDQGIYYGVIDEYPCRKIIATWKGIPKYMGSATSTTRQTYQMVCYEGSNIIEVHIKKRYCCSSTNSTGSNAFLGIQNEDGEAQQSEDPMSHPGTILWNIHDGAPGAYWPANLNPFPRQEVDTVAYRFTPQGDILKDYGWYILHEDGSHDTIHETTDNGINCYWEIMQGDESSYANFNDAPCPSLTKLHVRIDEPTKFVFYLRFHNALDSVYDLQDTVFVGVDRGHDINLHAQDGPSTKRSMTICAGQTARMQVDWPRLQDTTHTSWRIYRMLNGEEVDLQNSLIGITRGTVGDSIVTMPVTLNSNGLPALGMTNKIDSIYLQISADFANCTDSFSVFLVEVYPNFDTTVVKGICEGQRYYWTADSAYHAENTDPAVDTVHLHSVPGCDSIVRLDLTVYGRTHYVDTVYACEPYTWINNQTYYEDNTATALADTILLQNQWGCDSVVHLEFHMMPLTALIRTNVDHFTLSQLDVVLNDVSANGGSRLWLFPDGGTQTSATAYYTLPAELDSALIKLVAYSAYGDCDDTTQVVIPLQRENIWLPNAFTPENNAGNNLFGSISKNTLSEEMYIYNRHGELVYKCDKIDCTWDGKDLNGNACPQGTYVYIIRYRTTFEPDREQLLRGTVTLIR